MDNPTQSNYASKLTEYYEHCRKFAMEHNISVVTAAQPYRGGPGLPPEELARLADMPIFVDYINLL